MNPTPFLAEFASIAHAPNGITRLREMILQLAVQGKLVPQDANDEPASVLLTKIQAEKERLIQAGTIKRPKPLPAIKDEEKPFALPKGWEWVRLNDIGYDWGQITPQDEFSYIDVSAINNKIGIIESPTIIQAINAPSRARKVVKQNTVIYSTVRPYLLNVCVVEKNHVPQAIASTAFAVIHPCKGILSSYIKTYLRSPVFISYVEAVQTGIAYPAINDRQFFSGLFPLAPENEQIRIMEKVDDLLSLCDQLEAKQKQGTQLQHLTYQALLDNLTQARSTEDLHQAWQRLQTHLGQLVTQPEQVKGLREAILQLAVQGKLVPQDANDEPASVLLAKIQAEKEGLIQAGTIKRQKPLPAIKDEEKPFELPKGWEWVKLGLIAQINPRNDVDDNTLVSFVPMCLVTTYNDGRHEQETRIWRDVKKGFTHFAEGDIGVAKITPCFENGKAAIFQKLLNKIGAGTTELHIIRPYIKNLFQLYILTYLKSPMFLLVGEAHMTGTAGQKRLPREFVENNPFPLPPENEIPRIIAKVEALMHLCDQLEAKLQAARHTQGLLAEALTAA